LKPSTTTKMARPGKMPAHGALVMCPWAAAVSMPPQLGTSGGTPTPRKLSDGVFFEGEEGTLDFRPLPPG
jgi:hypothetical protein